MVKKFRTVQRDGIRFAGLRYFHPNIVSYVGKGVTVRFDPNDLAEIWVHEQNQLICKAVCEELKKLSTTRKKELRQQIKSKFKLYQNE